MYEKIFVWLMIVGIACLSMGCGNQTSVETGSEEIGNGSSALYKQQKQSEIQENIEISWENRRVQGDGDMNSTWGGSIQENDQYMTKTETSLPQSTAMKSLVIKKTALMLT